MRGQGFERSILSDQASSASCVRSEPGVWKDQLVARSRDGIEIAYETHGRTGGDAPAVVLVHGWAGNRTYWANQVDLLAE
jgi:hypothetical protein